MIKQAGTALILALSFSAMAETLAPPSSSTDLAPQSPRTMSAVQRACMASVADSATTIVALSQPGIVESNPLLPSNIPFMVFAAFAKCGMAHYVDKSTLPDANKTALLHFMDAIWSGAAVNNLAIIMGFSNPVGLAALAGFGYYRWTQGADERAYATLCTKHKTEFPTYTCAPYVRATQLTTASRPTPAAEDTARYALAEGTSLGWTQAAQADQAAQAADAIAYASLCAQFKAESPVHTCKPFVRTERLTPDSNLTPTAQDTAHN